ncbi:MAG: Regulatory protein CysR [Chroococcidiopsis cubana SAG 39.79]|jgi:CRP-like cAMP-binding protein|uniref:Crp/Fnr family transcriptional regulator n=2 Tax=Chroococcidiopsis TaxID=54298 RepID=A0AB37UQW9_9CYAN|nr:MULTISPECIES: Crp/Fnr family transcriptional regulator [Chroococcidiopsis]PSB46591.1 Crp/Fnr family transcriptional regulator [Cyanosarcina cf. burmensis CCALA 770]AFY86962.1 putative transcriptional regulator, Crp/Fnr family [Chroococcidiopsis thermalis PCC 7203]MDZ4874259.1 Regulatory protein CysR [Chroococcidiopsis cubana SAG 39.79]PSB64910.1 Crp/Fnr family transcriptional regulator [Chroococcidiopsis cubana CCALA 043]RUT13855.1 Crp/Fnr family transcriptional regulator [Chroococcidiopsis
MAISTTTPSLVPQSSQRLFARHDLIPSRPNILWRIERGAVRTVTWSESGTLITLGYWGAGDLVGQPLSRVVPYQIECLTSVETTIIPSELWHLTVEAMMSHVCQTEELLSIIHRKPVSLRLWQFLIWLGQKFGRDVDLGRLIDVAVTHQEIAEVINTTRVSVTRMLQQFEEEGLLTRHQRRIILRLPIGKAKV